MSEGTHVAFDKDGSKMPLSPDEVHQTALDLFDKGKLVLVVSVVDDAVAVNVMGSPNRETLEILESTTRTYRKIIEEMGL